METKKGKNTIFFHFKQEKYGFSEYFIQQAIEHSTCTIEWMFVSIYSLLNDKKHKCAWAFSKMKQTNERTNNHFQHILGYISMRKNQFDIALLDDSIEIYGNSNALHWSDEIHWFNKIIIFFFWFSFVSWLKSFLGWQKQKKTKNNFRDQKLKTKSEMKEKILVGKQGLHN